MLQTAGAGSVSAVTANECLEGPGTRKRVIFRRLEEVARMTPSVSNESSITRSETEEPDVIPRSKSIDTCPSHPKHLDQPIGSIHHGNVAPLVWAQRYVRNLAPRVERHANRCIDLPEIRGSPAIRGTDMAIGATFATFTRCRKRIGPLRAFR
jgi:hypothetical protein